MEEKSFEERHSEALALEAKKASERLVGLKEVRKALRKEMRRVSLEMSKLRFEYFSLRRKIENESVAIKEYQKWSKKVLKVRH